MNKGFGIIQGSYPAIATDCAVLGFDGRRLNVLLLEREGEAFENGWAFPGGLMNDNETVEECAGRVLRERTGLTEAKFVEFGTYSDIKRDPRGRVISVAFLALVRISDVTCGEGVKQAKWFRLDQLPSFALDYDKILKDAQRVLREKMVFEPLAFDLLDRTFSMTKLQRLYESILEITFDRRNFYRKILTLGILEREDGKKSAWLSRVEGEDVSVQPIESVYFQKGKAPSRTPFLYRFNREKYEMLKQKGHGFKLEF